MQRLRLGLVALLVLTVCVAIMAPQKTLSRARFSVGTEADFSINATVPATLINPLIYGVNNGDASVADLNVAVNRWGGTPKSTYDWNQNAYNVGLDYYFESVRAAGGAVSGGEPDAHVAASQAEGAAAFLTVPLLSHLAKLDNNGNTTWSFSVGTYGAQAAADGDAGDGLKPGANIYDPQPSDFISGTNPSYTSSFAVTPQTYQAGWLTHLTNTWGTAANGGVRFYGMDNEPGIWHTQHHDVHPLGASTVEVAGDVENMSATVRAQDASAQVLAPEEWNYEGYLFSGEDVQSSANNQGNPDHDNNGDYIPALLKSWQAYDIANGTHTLDYLSVHYYPQGNENTNDQEFSDDTSRSTELLRNQSTRSLWDPNYVDQSYVNDLGAPYNKIQLIPRLKGWVSSYYPGLKTAVSEYSWGAEGSINGATAQADVLGIFGREGLDMACRWEAPAAGTPVANAFKIYRNYDGHKSTFGDMSIPVTTSENPDTCVAFAAQRSVDGAITIMVVNKDLDNSTPVNFTISNTAFNNASVFQLTSANTITQLADVFISNNVLATTVPAQSITLFVLNGNGVAATPTPAPVPTLTPVPPTPVPTPTPVPLPTATPIPAPTATPIPLPTATPTLVPTPLPTMTPGPVATPPPALKLSIAPTSFREDAGATAALGTVTLPAPAKTAVTVTLTSSNNSKATVPHTVIIPAGATSTYFDVAAIDNALVDGPRPVIVTATAPGLIAATATLTVTDNDTPTLTLTATVDHFSESAPGAATTLTVRRNTATTGSLVVSLTSSNPAKAKVQASVTIPAGAASATVPVTAVNNNLADGSFRVTFTARAGGFVSGSQSVTVLDDEPASKLTLSGHVTATLLNASGATGRVAVPGVSVSLYTGSTLRDVVTTNAAGLYQFAHLPPGTYKVVPAGTNLSFAVTATTVTLVAANVANADFIAIPHGEIGGRLTRRATNGAIQGLAGIAVTARYAHTLLSVRTNAAGYFLFDNLPLASYTIVPSLTGTFFQPRFLAVALSPSALTQLTANFAVAGADVGKPTVGITTPKPGTYTFALQPTTATGTAADNGAAGPALVTVAVARFASATATTPNGFYNWTTGAFITTDNATFVENLATGTTAWKVSNLPTLLPGFYGLRATVTDAAGNVTHSAWVRWSITLSVTSHDVGATDAAQIVNGLF